MIYAVEFSSTLVCVFPDQPRRGAGGAALLHDGSVLVIGGESQAWGRKDRPFASCEGWIDPANR